MRMESILSESLLPETAFSDLVRQAAWILDPASYLAVATIWTPSSLASFSKAETISSPASASFFSRLSRTMLSLSMSLRDAHLTSSGLSPDPMASDTLVTQSSNWAP